MALRLMKYVVCLLLACVCGGLMAAAPPAATDLEVIALSYHDVRDDVDLDIDHDSTAVGSRRLAEQFEWLRQHGYQPVSITQIQAARDGKQPLPAKAVLLTFDDGYASFHTRIFPLLKLYQYPAVMALVGSWLDVPPGGVVQYGDEKVPREKFLDVAQIREMHASGLVEFASHTYNLHRGVPGNPQGNTQAALVTRQYDPVKKRYESERAQHKRVQRDLQRNHVYLKKLTGDSPRVMVWPFGEWSQPAEEAARAIGYEWFLMLGHRADNRVRPNGRLYRHLLVSNPMLDDFANTVQPFKPPVETLRAAHVDLDYVYDPDPRQQAANLDRLLERIKRLRISTVYLQAFADPDGDGNADAMYFPNASLPMRADLFNRVAWQLKTRAHVQIYAWMPVSAFDYGDAFYKQHGVYQWSVNGSPVPSSNAYRRLSFFDPLAQERIRQLYRDLATYANFQGVLFHDDALLDADEDFHPFARKWYAKHGLSTEDYAQWKHDPAQRTRFTLLKMQALDAFIQSLVQVVREQRPDIRTARNLYAATALDAGSVNWLAQDLDQALEQYDHVALMAMPWMEQAADPAQWTTNLIAVLSRLSPLQRDKLVVELQTRDWRTDQPVDKAAFQQQVLLWKRAGYRNFAWYPDDFIANVPDFNLVFRLLSLEDYPYAAR